MNLNPSLRLLALCFAALCTATAHGASTSDDAAVFFTNIKDGQTVTSPVTIKFGIKNMTVSPAGVEKSNSGHHHLLINVDDIDLTAPIPSDEHHRHFGKGQTETTLDLEPGTYELQLLLGDYLHRPHATPVMSKKITLVVSE